MTANGKKRPIITGNGSVLSRSFTPYVKDKYGHDSVPEGGNKEMLRKIFAFSCAVYAEV